MKFNEQIKSPKWQKKRLEVLELHKFTCEECKATDKTLHVHHVRYIKGRKYWEYDNDVLMCLCEDCHSKKHEKQPEQDKELMSKMEVLINELNYPERFIESLIEINRRGDFKLDLFINDIWCNDEHFERLKQFKQEINRIDEQNSKLRNLNIKLDKVLCLLDKNKGDENDPLKILKS